MVEYIHEDLVTQMSNYVSKKTQNLLKQKGLFIYFNIGHDVAESLIIGSGLHLPEAFAVVVCVYNQLTSGVFPSISHRYTLSTISVYTRYSPHEKRCPLIRQLN